MWTSKRGRDVEETGTESDMTEGTEETITDLEEVPAKTFTERSSKKAESSKKETTSSIHSVESDVAIRIEQIAACSCKRLIGISSYAADKALALLLPDKGPRSMEISTVYTCQDTENECETELCGVDKTHKCDRAEETEQWLIEDFSSSEV